MTTHDADMRRSEPMGLTGLDPAKMATSSGAATATISVSWSGVEVVRVELWRVMSSPMERMERA
jgi:hypothetical protein